MKGCKVKSTLLLCGLLGVVNLVIMVFLTCSSGVEYFDTLTGKHRPGPAMLGQFHSTPDNGPRTPAMPSEQRNIKPAVHPEQNKTTNCYSYDRAHPGKLVLLGPRQRRERNCQHRLPGAIVIGVKKSGTDAFHHFMQYHPDVAFALREVQYFSSVDDNFSVSKRIYLREMPYSSTGQLTMEVSPRYFPHRDAPGRVKAVQANAKIIVLVRDPVKRAISDYLQCTHILQKLGPIHSLIRRYPEIQAGSRYETKSTFEESVLFTNGTLKTYNLMLVQSRYADFLARWLEYFPLERILVIDGDAFAKNPVPSLNQAEDFLGIENYFTSNHFTLNEKKGFHCLDKPIPNNCLPPNKGRLHPKVNETLLQTLRDYFKPFNKKLYIMLNRTFDWEP